MGAEPLRLLAEDAEDLKVIAASLQDAVAKIGDIRFEATPRRLSWAVNTAMAWSEPRKRAPR